MSYYDIHSFKRFGYYTYYQYLGAAPWVLPVTPYKCFSYVVIIYTSVLASVYSVVTNKLID